MRVDRHVQGRQVGEMPHDVRLGQLRQRGGSRPCAAAGNQLVDRRAAARRRPATARRAAAGLGEFEQRLRGDG